MVYVSFSVDFLGTQAARRKRTRAVRCTWWCSREVCWPWRTKVWRCWPARRCWWARSLSLWPFWWHSRSCSAAAVATVDRPRPRTRSSSSRWWRTRISTPHPAPPTRSAATTTADPTPGASPSRTSCRTLSWPRTGPTSEASVAVEAVEAEVPWSCRPLPRHSLPCPGECNTNRVRGTKRSEDPSTEPIAADPTTATHILSTSSWGIILWYRF